MGGRATGVRTRAALEPAGAVVLAAGPVDAGAGARAGRAAVGRQRRGAAARAAAARARAGRDRRADRHGRRRSSLFSIVTAGRRLGGRLDVPAATSPTRPSWRRCCSSAARASCPRWRGRDVRRPRLPAPAVARRPAAARPARGVEGLHLATGHGAVGHLARPGLGGAGGRRDPRRRDGDPARAGGEPALGGAGGAGRARCSSRFGRRRRVLRFRQTTRRSLPLP